MGAGHEGVGIPPLLGAHVAIAVVGSAHDDPGAVGDEDLLVGSEKEVAGREVGLVGLELVHVDAAVEEGVADGGRTERGVGPTIQDDAHAYAGASLVGQQPGEFEPDVLRGFGIVIEVQCFDVDGGLGVRDEVLEAGVGLLALGHELQRAAVVAVGVGVPVEEDVGVLGVDDNAVVDRLGDRKARPGGQEDRQGGRPCEAWAASGKPCCAGKLTHIPSYSDSRAG